MKTEWPNFVLTTGTGQALHNWASLIKGERVESACLRTVIAYCSKRSVELGYGYHMKIGKCPLLTVKVIRVEKSQISTR